MAKNKTPNRVPNGAGAKAAPKTTSPVQTKAVPPITLKPDAPKTPAKGSNGLGTKTLLKKEADKPNVPVNFVFEKQNFQWMFIGIGVLVLGFFLMSGTTDIMSPTKIILAPFIVLVGFAIEFYAILLNPTKKA